MRTRMGWFVIASALFGSVAALGCGSAKLDTNASFGSTGPAPAPTPAPAPAPTPPPVVAAQTGDAILEGDRIRILKAIHYEVDKDEIKPESLLVLDAVGAILMSHPEIVELTVEGHTDDQGNFEHNRKLSERRANAVVRYLALKGVKQIMQAPGYGATAPVCRTPDEPCRAQNRRVEFKVKRAP